VAKSSWAMARIGVERSAGRHTMGHARPCCGSLQALDHDSSGVAGDALLAEVGMRLETITVPGQP